MVEVGAFLPSYGPCGGGVVSDILDVARVAENRGLQHLWVGDHFVWNTGMLAPFPTLAAVATATSRIRLGTGVYLANLRQPAVIAKEVATVDVLSAGRVTLGVGAGGDDPAEYAALGVELERRGQRLEETVLAVRSLLDGHDGPSDGELVRMPAFSMQPAPVQSRVPIWFGGRADAVVRRASRIGEGWFPVWVSAKRIASGRELVAESRGDTAGFALALNVFVALADSREKASRQVADHLQEAYRLPFEKFERYAAYGTAADIGEFLQEYLPAGVTDIALNLTGAHRVEQLEGLICEVLPGLGWSPA